jgi:hypothetical protein
MFSGFASSDQRKSFPVSSARLWDALLKALESSPLVVRSLNKALKRAEVSSGLSMTGWGRSIVVRIEPVQMDESTLVVTAASRRPSARDLARTMKVTNDLVERVSSKLS